MPPRELPNWLQGYLLYTNENESPIEYHTWCALSTIAGVLRRRVWFDMTYFKLYPNLYSILVGPAGRCKKSTAMRMARELLTAVPGVQFTADSITREKLIQDLTQSRVDDHSSMTAYSSEFASLVASSGMDMIVFLTDIYESPDEWSHKTKMGGTLKIIAPCLNLLGATTPDWISSAMPLDTIGLGMTSRIIFVYQDTPRVRPPFPKLSNAQRDLKPMLGNDLVAMSCLHGEYQFTNEAYNLYVKWYTERLQNPNPTGDRRLDGYFDRKPMHVIKVCMCIAASKRDELVMQLEDLQDAFVLLETTEARMPKVFASVGRNTLSADMFAIEEMIATRKSVSYQDILGRFRHNVHKEELDEILTTLAALGHIKSVQSPEGLMITWIGTE